MFVLATAVVAVGAACDALGFGYTNIGEIAERPAQHEGREAKIRGRVVEVAKLPILETKFYTLRDDTGEVLVMTTGALPEVGSEARVRGTVESVAIVGGRSFGLHVKEVRRW